MGLATSSTSNCYFLNERSLPVCSRSGLQTLATSKQTTKSGGVYVNGYSHENISLLSPMSFTRKPTNTQDVSLDLFRSIPKRFFDVNQTAFLIGFRVGSDKKVNPLFLDYDDNTKRCIGIVTMVSSASTLIDNLRKTGDFLKLDTSHAVPDAILSLTLAFLSSPDCLIRGQHFNR